jgi:hypothetical protein
VVIVFRYIWYYCGIFYLGLWYLTSGIRELSLAAIVGNFFYFFCRFSFLEKKKKRAKTFQTIYVGFGEFFLETNCISEFLSKKHPS